jgi:hypothetical protein
MGFRFKAAAVLGSLALVLSTAGVGSANKGGVPHSTKPCPAKAGKHTHKHPPKNDNGKKCGHRR